MATTERVLITGAAGNIGSALTARLLGSGRYEVVALDDLSTGARSKLPEESASFRFVRADVNRGDELRSALGGVHLDYVFHFAAVVGVQRTLANPLKVLGDIDGIKNVLSLAKESGAKRAFYSSSSEVYGEPVSFPQHEETTPLNSRLPYAIVKNVGESFFRSYFAERGLEYTIFRFFNTYGPNQSEDFVVPRFLNKALRGEPITINGDGRQTRTFCYIDDNTETIARCLERGLFVNDVLNIGSDAERSVLSLAELIVKVAGSKSEIVHGPALKEGDMTRRSPDIAKMRKVLDRPLTPLEKGLQRLIEHKSGRRGA